MPLQGAAWLLLPLQGAAARCAVCRVCAAELGCWCRSWVLLSECGVHFGAWGAGAAVPRRGPPLSEWCAPTHYMSDVLNGAPLKHLDIEVARVIGRII